MSARCWRFCAHWEESASSPCCEVCEKQAEVTCVPCTDCPDTCGWRMNEGAA